MAEPVVIVGAGVAGLACALRLREAGLPILLLEASDRAGGRVRTDRTEGFLLDRGFQVLLSRYPEASRFLDLDALDLRPFLPGALVHQGGRFHVVADPLRRPSRAWRAVAAPFVSLSDLLPLHLLHWSTLKSPLSDVWTQPETTTRIALQRRDLSEPLIESFFRPFFGGVFLDLALETSSRMFYFTYRMFATGEACLPAGGMDRIPAQMTARLPAGTLRTGVRVGRVEEDGRAAILESSERIDARCVVVATEGDEAARLLGGRAPTFPGWRRSATIYFAADHSPLEEPVLVLDGDGHGPINHLCVPSLIAPGYAPAGAALISASTVGLPPVDDGTLVDMTRGQLAGWFGAGVHDWRLLSVVRVPRALPIQTAMRAGGPGVERRSVRLRPGIYLAGDHRGDASINGALESGRRAAEALIDDRV